MKKNLKLNFYIFLVAFIGYVATQKSLASEYTISFTQSGIVNTLDSVVVLNHTKGTKVVLAPGDILGLNIVASINRIEDNSELIKIYPNPMTEKSRLTFFASNAGKAQIKVMSIDGKIVVQTSTNYQAGDNSFILTLPEGAFAISIVGNGFSYSAKALSQTSNSQQANIEFVTNVQSQPKRTQKSKSATISMEYQTGDKMLYKAYSANYCNTVADVPVASKDVNFKFAECKDASDNYYYNFVTIGTQVWMVDNLRTTKFNNGASFNNYTNNDTWKNLESIRKTPGWCNFNNDASTDIKYGKLYNFSAATDARGINPLGWHLPTREEWQALQDLLIANGYDFDAPSAYNSLNKSLAANTDWEANTTDGTPGNDLTKNNATGFTALPVGYRASNGEFYGGRTALWSSTGNGYASYMWTVVGDWKNLYSTTYPNQTGCSIRCIMD